MPVIRQFIQDILLRIRGEWSPRRLRAKGAIIGSNLLVNGLYITPYDCALLTIGDNVVIAPDVRILAHDASLRNVVGHTRLAPVRIGDDVFVGAGSVLLPGVTIGSGAIIAAGSLVNRDIPPGTIAGGVPAKAIGDVAHLATRWRALVEDGPKFDRGWKDLLSDAEFRRAFRKSVETSGTGWAY